MVFTLFFLVFQGGSFYGNIAYRAIFVSTTVTYLLSLFQRFQGQRPSFYVLLRMDSFQYGALGFFWLFTKWHFIKIIPFAFFSAMHTAEYVSQELKPGTKLAADIEKFFDTMGEKLYRGVAWCNIVIGFRLILDCLAVRRGSSISLLAFGFFYRIRIAYSPVTAEVLQELLAKVDTLANHPKSPAKVKDIWSKIKEAIDNYETVSLDPKVARERIAKLKALREKEAKEEKLAEERFEKQHYK